MDDKIEFPIRINRYLAKKQICTRREADKLISDGKILINNRIAVLGDKVGKNDEVLVKKDSRINRKFAYLAYNKPRGIITHSPQKGEKEISEIINYPVKLFPVGRLDKDSSGLIILTNDGRITDRMLNPDYYHEKEYLVEVDRTTSPSFLKEMGKGVKLEDGYITRSAKIEKIDSRKFTIILTEGRKHQIRRMCEALGRQVKNLKRIRILNISLDNLRPGEFRKIESNELDTFLNNVGMAKR
jgi:23S rRNA pseudouridine2604 synthase